MHGMFWFKIYIMMIQEKSEQFNATIFNGTFITNKPVVGGFTHLVSPYSNIFYWSHAIALDDCEFGLHPHKGFEIMTFVLEGTVAHFDTTSKIWTSLKAGDFQVIQSNKGIYHQEKISKGARVFQIWFDPNFEKSLMENPHYLDYHSKDFQPMIEDGIRTINYVGNQSKAFATTPDLVIKKLIFDNHTKISLQLEKNCSYTFYVLNGTGLVNNQQIIKDDAIRIADTEIFDFEFSGELFYVQTSSQLDYKPVWTAA
jgi:redox-sensitive bicupin YhaK (pirin superfamily)